MHDVEGCIDPRPCEHTHERRIGSSSSLIREAAGVPDAGNQVDAAQDDEQRLGEPEVGNVPGEQAAKDHAGCTHNDRGHDFAPDKATSHAEVLHKEDDDEIRLMPFMRARTRV